MHSPCLGSLRHRSEVIQIDWARVGPHLWEPGHNLQGALPPMKEGYEVLFLT